MTSTKKKILFLERCNSGGLAHYAHEVCSGMARLGHNVTLLTLGEFEVPPEHRAYNTIEIPTKPCKTRAGKGMLNLQFVSHALSAIRSTSADAVFLDGYQPIMSWPFTLIRPRKVPVFCIQHEVEPRVGNKSISYFQRDFYNRVTAMIVHRNSHSQDLLIEKYRVKTPIFTIDHGLYEADLFGRQAAGTSSSTTQILSFGIVRADKGLDVMVKAYPGREECGGLGVLIAGQPKGNYGEYFSKVVAESKDVTWNQNFIPSAEIGKLYRDAAFVVLPFLECAQSGSLRMAMFFEKPIIASAVGEIPSFVDKFQVGMLVPPGDVAALRKAMIEMATNPAKRAGYAENIKRLNAGGELSWQTVLTRLFAEIEERQLW